MGARSKMAGQPIECKAMVAFGVDDLREEVIIVGPPQAGEVRVKVICNALCHTDIYTLSRTLRGSSLPSSGMRLLPLSSQWVRVSHLSNQAITSSRVILLNARAPTASSV